MSIQVQKSPITLILRSNCQTPIYKEILPLQATQLYTEPDF